MFRGDQGGVGGGGNGGEAMEVNGFLGGKEEEEDDGDGVVVVGMVEEMEEKKVEELVEMVGGMVENGCRPRHGLWLRFAAMLSVGCKWRRKKEKVKEREEEKGRYIYKGIV